MRTVFFFIAFLCGSNIYSQNYKVVQVAAKQSFELNSGGRLGGTTRTYLPVSIPEGAVSIVYVVKSSVDYDAAPDIKLAAKLTATLTGSFVLSRAIDFIDIPPSNAKIDAFLLPQDGSNLNMFLNKQDGQWSTFTDYTCLNSLGCKRNYQVRRGDRFLYLGLRNPSLTTRIIVTVDIVAIVEGEADHNTYSGGSNSSSHGANGIASSKLYAGNDIPSSSSDNDNSNNDNHNTHYLKLINNTGRKISVALAYFDNGESAWVSRGWYSIDANNYYSIDLDELHIDNNTVYLHEAVQNSLKGNSMFCVGESQFKMSKRTGCISKQFSKVAISRGHNTYTFRN